MAARFEYAQAEEIRDAFARQGVRYLLKKYQVVGLPTVIVIDASGKEVARFNELVPAEKFSAALAAVR